MAINYGELDYLSAGMASIRTVKTVAGQSYELSFDARSRFAGSSSDIEVLWNNSVVATIPPGSNWSTYNFAVTGTGGQDRLTFREANSESVDGLGALYDNVSLVAKQSAVSAASNATRSDARSGHPICGGKLCQLRSRHRHTHVSPNVVQSRSHADATGLQRLIPCPCRIFWHGSVTMVR